MQDISTGGRSRSALFPILLTTTMLAGVPTVAVAQQQGSSLETVVVTAEKREENLQKVPMNVQAFTSIKLKEMHLTDFTDFAKYMPSVTYAVSGQGSNGGPGFANITMRGIASDQNGNHSGPLPTVGVYLDEQPITTIGGTLDVPTYDVERVEALSGPQGTLYGASSESGTIRIITNKPDTSGFSASYQAEVNSIQNGGIGYNVHGYANVPLADNIAVRMVAWDEHDAGYIDNVHSLRTFPGDPGAVYNPFPIPPVTIDNAARAKSNYNTVDKLGARLALAINLDDNWTITPSITAQHEESDGVFGYDKVNGFGYNRPLGDLQVSHFFPEFTKDDWYQAALTVQGKIANLDVVYSGGYMNRNVKSESDYTDYTFFYQIDFPSYDQYFVDNGGNPINPSQYIVGKDRFLKQSHELRISTSKDNRLRAVGGIFYEDQTHFILQDYKVLGAMADSGPFNNTVTGWPNTLYLADQYREDKDFALFGELAFDITPSVTLTGGIRYFTADNSLKGFFGFHSTELSRCFSPTPIVDRGPCTDLNAKTSDSGETHKVNLTWQVDDNKMLYATYSTGFRPGGVNRRTDIPGVGPYTSDTLTNYEVGWKTRWNDDTLRFNGAFYWEEWKDFQFPFLGPNSITIIANAGQARVKGMETQVTWLPMDGLTLTGASAYNEADLTQNYCGGPCSSNPILAPNGTQMPITPKWKVNGTARYEFPLDGDFNAHLQGSIVHQSGTWADLRTVERNILGQSRAYTTFDFTAGIERDNWSVELSLLNAFDERAQLGRYGECAPGTCGPQTYILVAQPRTIGLSFSQSFD